MDFTFFPELIATILLSGLVGLERERKCTDENKGYFAGFRSFILIGLIGFTSFLSLSYSPFISILLAISVLVLISISYFVTAQNFKQIGITSELAGILVFVIGFISAKGDTMLATSITLVLVALLHFKTDLHNLAKKVKDIELISTLQFIFIAFIVLRILPNQAFGPFDFFNPFFTWLMVVFISGISFASYIGIKLFGAKYGITLTGFFAGLISSTALTLSFSEQSKKTLKIINPYVLAIIIAQCGMIIRVIIEVAVINPYILPKLIIPLTAMFVVGIISILYINKKSKTDTDEDLSETVELSNPFRLLPAIKFGALFALILFLTKVANHYFGGSGIYVLSLISGLFDLDAITISLSSMSKNGLAEEVAIRGITIAGFTNTIVKALIFRFLGAKKPGKKILLVFIIMVLIASISLFFI
jgi:uncharacterized membrane protein (DUF4010 family)